MPTIESLQANDEALHEMFKADTENGGLSEEDAKAYKELIESQRTDHITTQIEVKDESGGVSEITVRNIGDRALTNPMNDYTHSETWQTERK